MKLDENTFKPISDIYEIIKYDGFIAPDGSFYKVSIKINTNQLTLSGQIILLQESLII